MIELAQPASKASGIEALIFEKGLMKVVSESPVPVFGPLSLLLSRGKKELVWEGVEPNHSIDLDSEHAYADIMRKLDVISLQGTDFSLSMLRPHQRLNLKLRESH